jgi:hypothetical protein
MPTPFDNKVYEIESLTFFPQNNPIKTNYSLARNIFLFLVIVTITVIILLLLWGAYYSYQKSLPNVSYIEDNPIDPAQLRLSNFGASSDGRVLSISNGSALNFNTCAQNPNAFWRNGRCFCDEGYWGTRCDLQPHSRNYLPAGSVAQPGEVITSFQTVRQSFSQDSCETACDEIERCRAYTFEQATVPGNPGTCTFYSSLPRVNFENLDLDPLTNNTFIKRSEGRPLLQNSVIFASRNFRWPARLNRDTWQRINLNSWRRIEFVPVTVINDVNAILIYAASALNVQTIRGVVSGNNLNEISDFNANSNIYIHVPGRNNAVPPLRFLINASKRDSADTSGNISFFVYAYLPVPSD